ncbi:DnaJ C-terminal domain-containing protein [Rhizobium alvei]|uniref:DnaJ domain-containing protein n=1 Tax=Rhizobium alvei TaxID=1132659 RepID=A0ABT8YGG7_9HYPH|nr:DnaJ C-terminal domain-containing protein [Rhizobium alvei]MDO6962764.1 DnaJ domain-containing protein [Rhizobium alvei]
MRDPYYILGVSRSADQQEIKAAWRSAAKELHPDQNPDDPLAAQKFAEIGQAYDLLKDPDKRRRYDEAHAKAQAAAASGKPQREQTFMERRAEKAREEAEARAAEARAAAAAAAAAAAMHPDAGEAELQQAEDVVARIFGTRKSSWQSAQSSYGQAQYAQAQAGRAQAGAQSQAQASAARQETYQSQRDHAHGFNDRGPDDSGEPRPSPARDLLSYLVKRLTRQVPPPDKAPDMHVDAWVSIEDLINRINPSVTLPDGKMVSVPLPEDATEGSIVRIEGYGHKLPNMKRGDVVARLRVKSHSWYRVDGNDLRTVQRVDIENAVLGCQTVVETPKGEVKVDVPPWTGSDHTIRIAGHGLPRGGGGFGDMIVEIRVMLWDHPDQKVIDLMRSLREGLFL